MVPGARRRGGPLHDEMAQGRGGEELATPRTAEDAKSSDKGKPGRGGAAVLIQLSTNAETKW